ncbi:hypothetical protein LTR66_010398 [Elasticomyces elasticus]|nr:hypothetical protein LTR66_010398 [Elasticomyces elasticus]
MIRGDRFQLDLNTDNDEAAPNVDTAAASTPLGFVLDVQERGPATVTAPNPPSLKDRSNGFPAHKKRAGTSKFKQKRAATKDNGRLTPQDAKSHNGLPQGRTQDAVSPSSAAKSSSVADDERSKIDAENRERLAQMTPDQVAEERRELMSSLDPSLIERLLRRANVDDGERSVQSLAPDTQDDTSKSRSVGARKTVTFAAPEEPLLEPANTVGLVARDEDEDDEDRDHSHQDTASTTVAQPPFVSETTAHGTVHFPQPPQPPDLDPASDTFLADLHEKYFPSLPADPSKLEWMAPNSDADAVYSPSATAFNPQDIRFSFAGALIPPKSAAAIPVTRGLHHHGDAPNAAGYTIPELALLARSSYPAQRCIAYQTLGRILYRLGVGEFGDPGQGGIAVDFDGPCRDGETEDAMGELARALWRELEGRHVVEVLLAEAEGNGRHMSAKAYATEAIWLWRRGGGRRWNAV